MLTTNSWLNQLPPYSLLRNDDRKTRIKAKGQRIFDFGIGDPLEETPLFIREALVNGINPVSQYPSAVGSLEFREACAAWVKRRFDVTLKPTAHVISANGSKESVFHIPQVLFNTNSERKTMIYPDPGYPVYKNSTILNGGTIYEVSLTEDNNFLMDVKSVPQSVLKQTAAAWICYPHNPTGATITKQHIADYYRWALANDIVLLSDECYVDMYFPNTPRPHSFLEVAAENNFKNLLCFFSLSKRSGMTGYRSGFVAGDDRYIAAYAKYRPHAGLGTPEFVQKAAIAAWGDDKHVVERNSVFAKKRAIVDTFFDKHNVTYLKTNATFYMWAKAPASYSSAEHFADTLAHATGIIVTPGDALGHSCDQWFRLALVPTPEQIAECLNLWDNAISQGAV